MEAQELEAPARRLPELDFEPVANARERQAFTGMIAPRSTSLPDGARCCMTGGALANRTRAWWASRREPVTCGAAVEHAGALASIPWRRWSGTAPRLRRSGRAARRRERRRRGFTGPLVLQSRGLSI